ncbi:MAG: RidA family protein [Thermoplasmataceae archaeon]
MLKTKAIDLPDLPKGGPYSHAVISGGFIFVSGQTGNAPDRETDFVEQFRSAMDKIEKILKEAGASLENTVKTTVYISEAKYFRDMNNLFGKTFKKSPPARTTIVCGFVTDKVLVEIDVIAAMQQ